jgi:hypothetical protein
VDADACPVVIKEILYRAAMRVKVSTTFVANTYLKLPPSPFIHLLTVPKGFDVADNRIVQALQVGDLVITADIPLAALVIDKDSFALNPRGVFYSSTNMADHLAMRNLMEELRSNGIETSGPSTFNLADRQLFASELDRFLTKYHLSTL